MKKSRRARKAREKVIGISPIAEFEMGKGETKKSNYDQKIGVRDPEFPAKNKLIAFITAIFVALLGGGGIATTLFLRACPEDVPKFALKTSYINPRDTIIIVPENRLAEEFSENLSFSLDGIVQLQGAKKIERNIKKFWIITLFDFRFPDSLTFSGDHNIRFWIPGSKIFNEYKIAFDLTNPSGNIIIESDSTDPGAKHIKGIAMDPQSDSNTIFVEIFFHSDGYPNPIQIPYEKIFDSASGQNYYRFETTVHGLPKNEGKKTELGEPFFSYRIRDQAGNEFHNTLTLGQYLAPGVNSFGFKDVGIINFETTKENKGNSKLRFIVQPSGRKRYKLPNGEDAIKLVVFRDERNVKQLSWNTKFNSIKNSPTTVFRGDKNIGITFENKFRDEKSRDDTTSKYRIEKVGPDGEIYSSNQVAPTFTPNIKNTDTSSENNNQNRIIEMSVHFISKKGLLVYTRIDLFNAPGKYEIELLNYDDVLIKKVFETNIENVRYGEYQSNVFNLPDSGMYTIQLKRNGRKVNKKYVFRGRLH